MVLERSPNHRLLQELPGNWHSFKNKEHSGSGNSAEPHPLRPQPEMKTLLLLIGAVSSCLLLGSSCHAEKRLGDMTMWERLTSNQKIFTVAVSPNESASYFTAESLKDALPRLHPAHILANWCKGKPKQTGVVVLENKDVMFWYSCQEGLIVFEGDKYYGSYGFK